MARDCIAPSATRDENAVPPANQSSVNGAPASPMPQGRRNPETCDLRTLP
jgi:hypothetical protein